jgi:hypothetical protein
MKIICNKRQEAKVYAHTLKQGQVFTLKGHDRPYLMIPNKFKEGSNFYGSFNKLEKFGDLPCIDLTSGELNTVYKETEVEIRQATLTVEN